MIKILLVQPRFFGKILKFVFKSGNYSLGNYAIFFTKNEIIFGKVISAKFEKDLNISSDTKNSIVREACESDWKRIHELKILESKRLEEVKQELHINAKNFKILYTELSFDMRKMYIYFSADERVELHGIIQRLCSKFKTKVEFRLVHARDAAKFIGGAGVCGREICCKTFLDSPKRINNLSVVNQSIHVNGSKFTGICGRLMCCLEYEEAMYSEAVKEMPKLGDIVKTPKGLAIVSGVNVISKEVKVTLVDDPVSTPLLLKLTDLELQL